MDIRFDHVFFAYDQGEQSERPALQDFSLHLPPDRTVALVGATGAAKPRRPACCCALSKLIAVDHHRRRAAHVH